MLENGALWSRRVRTCSHGWCADGRCVWMFMGDLLGFAHALFGKPVPIFPEHALILAIADGDGTARGLDRLLGELNIRDLLDRRPPVLVDIAVLSAVVDRPSRARGIEAGIDRPDAILVSTSMAYSTASFGLSVPFSRVGTTFALSWNMARLASIMAAAVSRSSARSRAIHSSEAP